MFKVLLTEQKSIVILHDINSIHQDSKSPSLFALNVMIWLMTYIYYIASRPPRCGVHLQKDFDTGDKRLCSRRYFVLGKCGTGQPSVLLIKVGVEGLALLQTRV